MLGVYYMVHLHFSTPISHGYESCLFALLVPICLRP